jgi:hypothetical protein
VILFSLIPFVGLLTTNANNGFFNDKYNMVSVQNKINSNIELVKSNLSLFLNENATAT